jgi:Serine dehydrogenase proteinase
MDLSDIRRVPFVGQAHVAGVATLIAIGADEIHMGPLGQLGPIDPQIGGLPALGVSRALKTIASVAETCVPSEATAKMSILPDGTLRSLPPSTIFRPCCNWEIFLRSSAEIRVCREYTLFGRQKSRMGNEKSPSRDLAFDRSTRNYKSFPHARILVSSSKHVWSAKWVQFLFAHLRSTLVSPSNRTISESPSATAAKIERPSEDQDTRRAMNVARSPKSVI